MTKKCFPVLAAAAAVVLAGTAAAQPPAPHDVFISANMAVQPSARTFQVSARPEI
jgi:hypothetical protein